MNAILLEELTPVIREKLQQLANAQGCSIAQAADLLLSKAPFSKNASGKLPEPDEQEAFFMQFCGKWDKETADAFDQSTAHFREIDPEMWK